MAVLYRPIWESLVKALDDHHVTAFTCYCGNDLTTRADIRRHWEAGHLDVLQDHLPKSIQFSLSDKTNLRGKAVNY
jgi:hypothetical protein